MTKVKVMTIFGTRPEAIKMAPVVKALKTRSEEFESTVVISAQHREMLDQVLKVFNITPDFDLNIMEQRQTLSGITTRIITRLDQILGKIRPDIILVHGDTTTTFAASISAFYHQISIGHVEAGLRTWQKYSPFPEEMNRQLTDVLSDIYFAPTEKSKQNLLKESHNSNNIFVTGNTAIDALQQTVSNNYTHDILGTVKNDHRIILLTMHRRENLGKPMEQVFGVIRQVIDKYPDVDLIYPVHLNPRVKEVAERILGNHDRIHLIDPLDVLDFHNLAARSYLIMTDSGGVQEEAPSLGKPVLVLRDTTERPEGVDAGTLKLVGTNSETINSAMEELLNDENAYNMMANAKNPYGDGKSSNRILDAISYHYNLKKDRPDDFRM